MTTYIQANPYAWPWNGDLRPDNTVTETHDRLLQVRATGGAILLVSEDLDELLELADRIVVMSEGAIVFETTAEKAQVRELGHYMAGGHAVTEVAA